MRVIGLMSGTSLDGVDAALIEIDGGLETQPRKQTLLHEIVHEILIQAGQNLGDRTEGVVDAVAFGWYQVMRDNPQLVRMIRK